MHWLLGYQLDIAPREYTIDELRAFDGNTPSKEHGGDCPVYMAVNGTVFDVTDGREFYAGEGVQ